MANTKLIFYGTDRSDSRTELDVFVNAYDEIFISIDDDEGCYHICLDKSTAIKFAKTLRTEINKMKDEDDFERLSNTF